MLPTKNRLLKERDFNLVIKHGSWINDQLIALKVLDLEKNQSYFPPKENPETFVCQLRVAFVVGLKISKSAVARNRIKRQMREIICLLLKENRIVSGYFLLFVARLPILKADFEAIKNDIEKLLKKAGVLSR